MDEDHVHCNAEGCDASYPRHRWGAITAYDSGWFAQKEGITWCPEHIPEWVKPWRAKTQQP